MKRFLIVAVLVIALVVGSAAEAHRGGRRHRHRPRPPVPVVPVVVVGPADWTESIVAGKAYWDDVGDPTFPNIREWVQDDPCGPTAIGCARLSTPTDCMVWFRPGTYGTDFAAQLAAHEVGHCLGLVHDETDDYDGVMRPVLRTPTDRADDVALCLAVTNC